MMINKRLIAMMGDSKRYIARNVALQWVALLANIAMIFAVSAFLAGLVYGQGSLSAAAGCARRAVLLHPGRGFGQLQRQPHREKDTARRHL